MGQIESNETNHTTNDLSDRKEIIGKGRGSTSSSDLNIKVEDNSEANKEPNDENNQNDSEKDKKLKKTRTHDFACTIFYGMVALLVFATMSRTYTSYSGGGCGSLYGVQSLLAYSCVGLACAIIRSLRKHIKAEANANLDNPDKEEEIPDVEVDTNGGQRYEVSTLTTKEKVNPQLNSLNDTSFGLYPVNPKSDALIVNITTARPNVDKLSSGLPLPTLPPPSSLTKRQVTFQTPNELSTLSAADLKVAETNVDNLKNQMNESKVPEELIIKNDWKDIKFDTELFRKRDNSQHKVEYNWNDYNLNSIDKY